MVVLKSPQEIEKIRKSNEIVSEILQILESEIQPKVNTLYLNDLSEKLAREKNAIPAFKGVQRLSLFTLCFCK